MSNEDRSEQLAQFQIVTNIDDVQTATSYLEASKWDINLAVSTFYQKCDGVVNADPPKSIK